MERLVAAEDEALLWTDARGEGPGMLLSSGGPGCCDYLAPISAMVEDRFAVVRWEQRGCGRSSADGPYDLVRTLADMEAIREAYGFESWVVGGHSWGADLSLAYALEHPKRTRAFVYLAGTGIQNDRDWKDKMAQNREARGPERLPEFQFPGSKEVNQEGIRAWRNYIKEPFLLRRVADLPIPALIVQAENDLRPNWPAAQLAHLLPKGEYHVLSGAEHCLWMTHGEELEQIIRDFLSAS